MSTAVRPYSEAELDAYLSRLSLSPRIDPSQMRSELELDSPRALGMMMRAHLERIPFENTFIPPLSPDLEATALHARFTKQKLGGYCFFHSLNMCNVLAGLAALSVPAGDTNRDRGAGHSWNLASARPVLGVVCVGNEAETGRPKFESTGRPTHCVCLVTLSRDDEKHHLIVDAGFGRKGPIGPVLLPSASMETHGPITSHPSLIGEEWRIRTPAKGELPHPREDLDQEWLTGHPLSAEPGAQGYIMEHRLVGKDRDGVVEGEWETLYAFSTHERSDLASFQALSDDVFKGEEGFTTKFRDHLTCSRLYRVDQGQKYPTISADEAGDYADPNMRFARLALTDMEVSSFETTMDGKGQKNKLERFADEKKRKDGLKRLFGLDVEIAGDM